MFDLLWTVPTFPLLSFLALTLWGAGWSKRTVAWVGVGAVALSASAAGGVLFQFIAAPPANGFYTQALAPWIRVSDLQVDFGLYLDALSAVMIGVVAFVSFWIHLYSTESMQEEASYARFFAHLNLFTAAMLILVLADNLLLLYLGWEAVGLCSYLLIGFWYADDDNAAAAVKAFQVTRIGDAALAVGIFVLFHAFGVLEIAPLLNVASLEWQDGPLVAGLAATLLLAGAVGKSAQLPLQTWLPDAMAGPTPVSALIHAATMVTAGVYLIARTHPLFMLAPEVQSAVALIGAVTLILAAFSALAQRDIKRVLAYSTMSQIGYMFLALGVGAWHAAIFHLTTHAFFKALLFLAAGVVIDAAGHERDIFRLGGLRRRLPVAFWTFVIGAAALSGLPLVTAGFFSKEAILATAWGADGGRWLFTAGLFGSLLTALYAFRLVFRVFLGESKTEVDVLPGTRRVVPLCVLAFFSIFVGFVQTPAALGGVDLWSGFLSSALPPSGGDHHHVGLLVATSVVAVSGIALAYWLFASRPQRSQEWARESAASPLVDVWRSGWGFDRLYRNAFVVPLVRFARLNRADGLDWIYRAIAAGARGSNGLLARAQSGRLGWYAGGLGAGAVLLVAITLLS